MEMPGGNVMGLVLCTASHCVLRGDASCCRWLGKAKQVEYEHMCNFGEIICTAILSLAALVLLCSSVPAMGSGLAATKMAMC